MATMKVVSIVQSAMDAGVPRDRSKRKRRVLTRTEALKSIKDKPMPAMIILGLSGYIYTGARSSLGTI
jgi:hypothetical protein